VLADKITKDLVPYSENLFEPSALNRVREVIPQGHNWRNREIPGTPSRGSVRSDYRLNYVANHPLALSEVRRWQIDSDERINAKYHKLYSNEFEGFYGENQIWVNIVRDEDTNTGFETLEFIDKQGRVVLKKALVESG